MTILELIQKTTPFFEKAGVPTPRLDVELLLAHVLGLRRMDLYVQFERALTEPDLDRLRPLVKRRAAREPLQHIVGTIEFCGVILASDKRALVPRHETELLVERALALLPGDKATTVLDLGTGAGAIAIALLAARRASIPSTSYIPVPHSNAAMGARLGALRDLWCSYLFNLPDSFITITDEMAALLKRRGTTAPIHIVYNGVDTSRFQPGDPASACQHLKLPLDKIRLGMIGRIEFRQQQQHLVVQSIAADPALRQSC